MKLRSCLVLAAFGCSLPIAAATHEPRWRIVHLEGAGAAGAGERPAFGSGRLSREPRMVAPFRRILVDDGANVEVAIGPRHAVEVEVDDNLLQHVTTVVEDGNLAIGYQGSYATNLVPRVRVTMPALDAIDLRASSDAVIRGLRGGRLAVTSIGSGDLDASGRLEAIDVTISGSGDVDLTALQADRVDVAIQGSGDADVGAPRLLSAAVQGSGDVRYSGNPSLVQNSVLGSGSIRRKGNRP